jgi:hypothetical protein
MKHIKHLCVVAGVLALSGSAIAADMGLGVGFGQNSGLIYAPINVTPSFRVEPFFAYYKEKNTSGEPFASAQSYSNYVAGVGLFVTQRVAENIDVFGGGRLGYLSRKEKRTQTSYSFGPAEYSSESSGYLIAPTIGFEYYLQKNISIGAEAAISYIKTSGTNVNYDYYFSNNNQKSDIKGSSTSTTTAVVVKYYFK